MWLKALALTAMVGAAVAVGSAPSSAEAGVRVFTGPNGTYVAARRGYRYPYYGGSYGYGGYGYSYPSYSYPAYGYGYSYPTYYSTPYYGYNYGYSYPSYGYRGRGAFVGPNGAAFYGPRGGFRIRY